MKSEQFIEMIEEEFSRLPADYNLLNIEIIEAVAARFALPPFASLTDSVPSLDALQEENPEFRAWCSTNTHPHRKPGYISAVISLKPIGGISGDITADEMEAVAAAADKFSFGEIRISHEQNVVLPHVRKDQLHALWTDLCAVGLNTANIGLITDIIACPGMDYCSLATARAIPVAQSIAESFRNIKRQHNIGLLDLNISGCINACGHHHVGNIGLLGVDRNGEEVYQITIGGSATTQASIGHIIGPAVAAEDVPTAIEAIVETYLQNRHERELFIDTYRRIGLTPFKEAVYAKS